MAQTISSQVVPNLTGEVFDVVGTSRSETYEFTNEAGLTSPVATNWNTMVGADTANFNISTGLNIKSFVQRYNGYPTAVEKLARNIAVLKGTTAAGVGLDFSKTWAVINQANTTKYIRLDNGNELDPSTIDSHTQWGQWWSRFKGSFDAAGFPVGAFESSLTQFSIMKRQGNATYTFDGYSPIMTHSGEALATNIGTQTNNLVFYTKDTTSATDRFARRGSRLFCRVEVDLYNTEYPVCDFGITIKTIEHIWFSGGKFYIMVLAADDSKYTFVSAPYDIVLVDGTINGQIIPQSVFYEQVVFSTTIPTESVGGEIVPQAILYESVIVFETIPTESTEGNVSPQDIEYLLVAVNTNIPTESAQGNLSPQLIEYIFAPPTPPVTPVVQTTIIEPSSPDIVRSTYTIQGLSFT